MGKNKQKKYQAMMDQFFFTYSKLENKIRVHGESAQVIWEMIDKHENNNNSERNFSYYDLQAVRSIVAEVASSYKGDFVSFCCEKKNRDWITSTLNIELPKVVSKIYDKYGRVNEANEQPQTKPQTKGVQNMTNQNTNIPTEQIVNKPSWFSAPVQETKQEEKPQVKQETKSEENLINVLKNKAKKAKEQPKKESNFIKEVRKNVAAKKESKQVKQEQQTKPQQKGVQNMENKSNEFAKEITAVLMKHGVLNINGSERLQQQIEKLQLENKGLQNKNKTVISANNDLQKKVEDLDWEVTDTNNANKDLQDQVDELEKVNSELQKGYAILEEKLLKANKELEHYKKMFPMIHEMKPTKSASIAQNEKPVSVALSERSDTQDINWNNVPQIFKNIIDVLENKTAYLNKGFVNKEKANSIWHSSEFKAAKQECRVEVITYVSDLLESYFNNFKNMSAKDIKANFKHGRIKSVEQLLAISEVKEQKQVAKPAKQKASNKPIVKDWNTLVADAVKEEKKEEKKPTKQEQAIVDAVVENKNAFLEALKAQSQKTTQQVKEEKPQQQESTLDLSDLQGLCDVIAPKGSEHHTFINKYENYKGKMKRRSAKSIEVGNAQYSRGFHGVVPSNEQLEEMIEYMTTRYIKKDVALQYIIECYNLGKQFATLLEEKVEKTA